MHKLLIIGVTAIVILPLAAAAAGHRKPGLWQLTIQTNFTKGGPQVAPEQLTQIQQMDMPRILQSCLTPEQAAKEDHPNIGSGNCQALNQNWSGNIFTADLSCHGREGDTHGHIRFVSDGDKRYDGISQIEGSNPHLGGDFAIETRISGQWQGADCGAAQRGVYNDMAQNAQQESLPDQASEDSSSNTGGGDSAAAQQQDEGPSGMRADRCVDLDNDAKQANGVHFHNNCPFEIELVWCYTNDQMSNCTHWENQVAVSAGGNWPVNPLGPYNSVEYAACRGKDTARYDVRSFDLKCGAYQGR